MRQKNDQACEAEGKSCGGLSTKIQAAVDALGNPVRLSITEGQSSEYGQANALIEGFEAEFILADKGYDSDAFVQSVSDSGAAAVIPPRKNRVEGRNQVERLFQKLKHYRRIATRYERLARNYMAMLSFVATII